MFSPESLRTTFRRHFPDSSDEIIVRAPGRVNLIGGHTDYNEGFVLPVGIDRFAYVVAGPRKDRKVRIFAWDFQEEVSFDLDNITFSSNHPWSNYQRGIAAHLLREGHRLIGMNLMIRSTIPMGAGLGSSAAIEMATAWALRTANHVSMTKDAVAQLCQRVENDFIGVHCGIMDQFASGLARRGRALFLDCRSLMYDYIPLETDTLRIVVCHSNVHRALTSSAYNQRRKECEKGLQQFRTYLPHARSLRDVTPEHFQKYAHRFHATIADRCRHVVWENERVRKAVDLLRRGNVAGLGGLMYQSHASLRDNYEVSSPELEALINIARDVDGVCGARMTGAGFGGCTVNLVGTEAIDEFQKKLFYLYPKQTGLQPEMYVCRTATGLRRISHR